MGKEKSHGEDIILEPPGGRMKMFGCTSLLLRVYCEWCMGRKLGSIVVGMIHASYNILAIFGDGDGIDWNIRLSKSIQVWETISRKNSSPKLGGKNSHCSGEHNGCIKAPTEHSNSSWNLFRTFLHHFFSVMSRKL